MKRASRTSNRNIDPPRTGTCIDSEHQACEQRFLSVVEVARLLGVSIHTIYGMISEGRLPFRHHKFGRRVLIDRKEFERWVADAAIAETDPFWRKTD